MSRFGTRVDKKRVPVRSTALHHRDRYASRGAGYLSEGTGPQRNAYGNVAAPLNGYLWDAAAKHHVSYRSYGEFAHRYTSRPRSVDIGD